MGICRPEETGADDADEAVEAAAAAVVGMDTVAEAVMVGESESERRLKHLFGGWIERRPDELDKKYYIRLSVAWSCWW